MSEAFLRLPDRRTLGPAPRRAARGLSLMAAPAFAAMALMTAAQGEGWPPALCSAAHGASPLGGMAAMYLIMTVFHLPPWLKPVGSRSPTASELGGDVRRPSPAQLGKVARIGRMGCGQLLRPHRAGAYTPSA